MKKTIDYTMKSGFEIKLELPAKYEICDRCRGSGTHVNPAIDEHGISPEEFAEDPDFEEGYFSGRYDIRCEEGCENGKAVVVDESRLSRRERLLFDSWQKQEADRIQSDADDRRTRFYENGGRW